MTSSKSSQLPLVVSMGDPCGIGPDIIISAWNNRKTLELSDFFVVGNIDVLKSRAQSLGIKLRTFGGCEPSVQPNALCVLETEQTPNGLPGQPKEEDRLATIEAINQSVDQIKIGKASALVTCPINKKELYEVGFKHPGHTEYLAELGSRFTSGNIHPVMMIAGPKLRTIPVTIHIPLKDVVSELSRTLIETTCRIANNDLKRYFRLDAPRIALAGLNPHAGESGTIGKEDNDIIAPAVRTLNAEGINAIGPLSPDTMFHDTARATYDVAVCMYHDQALIPAKTLGFDDSVNVTLGLPFIRTSPDHGTAYDIAGTGKASISSFVAALKMAADMASQE